MNELDHLNKNSELFLMSLKKDKLFNRLKEGFKQFEELFNQLKEGLEELEEFESLYLKKQVIIELEESDSEVEEVSDESSKMNPMKKSLKKYLKMKNPKNYLSLKKKLIE